MVSNPPNDKLKKVHELLVTQYSDIPEYAEFEKGLMQDEEKQRQVHALLSKSFADIPEFDVFTQSTGLKKKESTLVQEFVEQVTPEAQTQPGPVDGAVSNTTSEASLAESGGQSPSEQEPSTAQIANSTLGNLNRKFYGLVPDILNTYGVAEKAVNNYVTAPLGLEEKVENLEDTYGGKAAKALRETLNDVAYVNEKAKDNIAVQVGGGIGQVLSLTLTAGAGTGAKLPSLATSTASKEVAKELTKALTSRTSQIASAQMAGYGYEQAKAEGATDGEAFAQALVEAGIGKTEALPIGKALERMNDITGNRLTTMLVNGATGSVEEATQEAFQGYLSNVAAANIYDEGRDLLTGVKEQAVVGGGTGFIFNALLGAIGARKRTARTPQETQQLDQLEQDVNKVVDGQTQATEAVVEQVGKDVATGNFIEQEAKRIEDDGKLDGATPEEIQQEVEQLQANPKEYAQQQLEVAESLQEELSGKYAKENQKRIEALKEIAEEPTEGKQETPAEGTTEQDVELEEKVVEETQTQPENVQPQVEETVPETTDNSGTESDVNTDGKEVSDGKGVGEQNSEGVEGSQKEPVQKKRTEKKNEQPKKVTFDFNGIDEITGNVVGITKEGDQEVFEVESERYGRKITYKVRKEDITNLNPAQTEKIFSELASAKKQSSGGRIQPSPIQGVKPKKLRDIALDLSKGLGSKIFYTKKSPGKRKALGYYNPRNAAIAIRYNNDLDTTAHELGHALDDKFGVFSNIPANKEAAIKNELKPFSKFGSKPPKGHPHPEQYEMGEGVAEFFRAYIVNPEAAKQQAPEFFAWVQQSVPKESWNKVEAFSEDVRAFVGASAHDMIASNIDFNQDKVKESLLAKLRPDLKYEGKFNLTFADKVSQKFLNQFRPFEKAFNYAADVKGLNKQDIKPEKNATIMARLFLGVNEKMDNIFNKGLVNAKNKRLTDSKTGETMSLEWLLSPYENSSMKGLDAEMQEAITYMVAERTVELKGRFEKNNTLTGIGAGIFKDEKVAQKRLDEINNLQQTDPSKHERLTEGARRYREYADGVLRYMVDKGRLSEEVYQKIKKDNIQYVALQRIQEAAPDEPIQVFQGQNSSSIGSGKEVLKKIKGSSKTIKDPYNSLLDFTYKAIKESDRNEVMLAFREVFNLDRSIYDTNPEARNLGEIARPASSGDANTVKIFNNGELEYWQLQDDVYKSVKNITDAAYTLPPLLTFLPRALRWTVTNSPVFAARNIGRDIQQRLVVSTTNPESGYDVYLNKAKREEVKELYQLFGGGQGGYYLLNDDFYKNQMKFAAEKLAGDKNTILLNPQKLGENYQKWISSSEHVSRLPEFSSAFKKAKKEGLDDYNASLYAAFQARDLMDFSVAGEYMKIVNQLVPFSNAAVQGLRRTYRSAAANPVQFTTRMFLYSIVPAIGQRILVDILDKEEEYQELPAWRRDLFYNFPIADDLWLTIPKPFEIGAIGSGGERLVDMLYYNNDEAFDGYGGTIGRAVLPVDEAALAGPLRTFVEVLTNYDFFRSKHIIPTHEEGKALELRNTDRASRLGKALQSVVGVDARYLDHIVKNQFSYFGDAALKLSDVGREDGRNEFNLGDLGIFKNSPAYDSKNVQWVLGNAKEMGLYNDPLYREMNLLIADYMAGESSEERQKRGETLREFAKQVKKAWKDYGLDKPENADNKQAQRNARSEIRENTDRDIIREAKQRERKN
jgi:hypothetical protein